MVRSQLHIAIPLAMVIASLTHAASGPVTSVTIHFAPPVQATDGSVTITGCSNWSSPGTLMLPSRTAVLLIPAGSDTSKLTLDVEPLGLTERTLLRPVPVAPQQRPLVAEADQPDLKLDSGSASIAEGLVPATTHRLAGVARSHGYSIVLVELFPVRWNAGTGVAQIVSGYKVSVRAPLQAISPAESRFLRGSDADRARVAALVDNPWRLDRITTPGGTRAADWQYLIITPSTMVDGFAPLLSHRSTVDGLTTHIVSLEDVLTSASGRDDAERVRSFVQTAYADHGTRFLVLGGDADQMPVRGCYAMGEVSTEDTSLPTDLYFGALDGDWNADGDTLWGEVEDDVDLFAEVSVGRISASNSTEVQRQVAKIIAYETWSSAPFHALLLGESADATTWGGDMMDWAAVELGGAATDTLYDRDGYWSGNTLMNTYLNTGQMNLVTHMGHASASSVMKMSTSDASGLTNSNPFFVYSQGCYAGAFDQGDCMAEAFTVKGDGGAHAVIMNSRYGWYAPGSNLGSSNLFHREFLQAVYERHVTRLGEANDLSRHRLAAAATDLGSMRWCYFDLTLFGDPATPIHWQCDPTSVRIVPESIDDGTSIMRSDPWTLTMAVHDDCAGSLPADRTSVEATFSNGDVPVSLADDGAGVDAAADDGQYSGTWVPQTIGPVTVHVEASSSGLTDDSVDVPVDVVDWMGYTLSSGSGGWISTDGGTVLSGGDILGTRDDGGWIVDIGFPFRFYGVTYTDMMVGSNGLIQLEHGDSYSSTEESFPIPFPADDNGLLAPWWCDLDPGYSAEVRVVGQGAEPNRTMTVEWHDVPHNSGPSNGVTFQVTLVESTNEIFFRYQDSSFGDPDFDHGLDATVGIEGPNGRHGISYAWHQPELQDDLEILFSPIASTGQVILDAGAYACADTVQVQLMDLDLEGQSSVTVEASSTTEPDGPTVTLQPGGDPRIFTGSFPIAPGGPAADTVLQVTAGDDVTVTYEDAHPAASRTATASVDCTPPVIDNVQLSATHNTLTVSWTTSEPAHGEVRYGTAAPVASVPESQLSTSHSVEISGLEPCTRYLVEVEASDGCGNTIVDDAGGAFWTETTLGWSEVMVAELDSDPLWTVDNGSLAEPSHGWAFGEPTGGGGDHGGPDPTSGFTGATVYGVNLSGDYDNGLAIDQLKLTTPIIDCSELSEVQLEFRRWLGIERPTYDHARVQISVDGGVQWTTVWENLDDVSDTDWALQRLDISDQAAGEADVRIRWTLGATDGSWQYCGWNLDDVHVGGSAPCAACLDPPSWQGSPGITAADPLPFDRSGVDLEWTTASPECGSAVTYQLFLQPGSSVEWSNPPMLRGLAATTVRVLGLTPGATYSAAVRAVDDLGNTTTNSSVTTFVASGQLAGDADCSAAVSSDDLPALASALFQSATPSCELVDVNGDGAEDAADLAWSCIVLAQGLF